jgi:hypothetical protein
MPDLVVLLTPFILLLVVLLFGFVGCSIIYNPDNLPDPVNELLLIARVPATLTVRSFRFRWTDPFDVTTEIEQTNPVGTLENGHNVFSHLAATPAAAGRWLVRCRVAVREAGGATANDQGEAEFDVETSGGRYTAQFEATGTPTGADFLVTFVGLIEPS